MDNGLCATSSRQLYDQFLKDLSKAYTLSDQGGFTWYLGIGIHHDKDGGVLTLDQEKYIEMLLDRFSMEDAHSAPTPFKAGTRLLRTHSTHTLPCDTCTSRRQELSATRRRSDVGINAN